MASPVCPQKGAFRGYRLPQNLDAIRWPRVFPLLSLMLAQSEAAAGLPVLCLSWLALRPSSSCVLARLASGADCFASLFPVLGRLFRPVKRPLQQAAFSGSKSGLGGLLFPAPTGSGDASVRRRAAPRRCRPLRRPRRPDRSAPAYIRLAPAPVWRWAGSATRRAPGR